MRHARPDYNRIQDPAGLIPADEPVFLLRGQDIAAPEAVRHYAKVAAGYGAAPELVEACERQAMLMVQYQQAVKQKVPDLTPSPVQAMKQLQTSLGLEPDGIWGPKTQAAVSEAWSHGGG